MAGTETVVDEATFAQELLRFRDTLTELTLLHYPDVREAFAIIAETAARTLKVGRVSLWRYNPTYSAITCVAKWQDGAIAHDDVTISRDSHPVYWRYLHEGRTLSIEDAVHDPALVEFQDDYLPQNNIGALLDSSVRADGVTFGIVCAEHVGTRRAWSQLERLFVASVADRVGLVILMDEQRRSDRLLLQSQKMEALGLMAAGLAHDFNNVLSVMMTSSDMAMQALAHGEDATEDLQAISDSARRAAAMTRRLLTVARREPLNRERLELNTILQETQPLAERLLPANVVLTSALTKEPLVVQADRGFVDQALMNLLINAAHSMPDGGTIAMQSGRLFSEGESLHGVFVPEGAYARLSIRDEGGGITERDVTRVFDPFFTTNGKRGTGLGLAVVYNGMQQHGGLVIAQSEIGTGCTFHLLFPVDDGVAG